MAYIQRVTAILVPRVEVACDKWLSPDTVAPTTDEIPLRLEWRHTPRCELGLRIGLTVRLAWKLRGCRERARWLVVMPCCGGNTYICGRHRRRPWASDWACAKCGIFVTDDELKWIEL